MRQIKKEKGKKRITVVEYCDYWKLNVDEKIELLNTSNGLKGCGDDEETTTWEKIYFYQVPLDYIYRNLDQLILNIRITESNCLK